MDREKSKRAESSPKRGSKIPGREEGGKREGELLQPDLPKARTRLGWESGALPEPKERLLRRPKIELRILLMAPGSFGLILSNISMEIGPGDPVNSATSFCHRVKCGIVSAVPVSTFATLILKLLK